MIEIKGLSKTFRKKKESLTVLDNINLNVEQGTIIGIIGSSGAGKSTLIRSINLLEVPDNGQVIVNGKNLMDLSRKDLASERKKIGMIFQHFNLLSSRTVFENVALPLELDKKDKKVVGQKVTELLKIVGLHEKANEYPANLSGGQKQRVAIARALVSDPYLLLSDEATSALDPATTQSILQLLKDINQQLGITIIMISHEMDVIKKICNQIAVLDQGKLIAVGSSEQIISDTKNPVIRQFTAHSIMDIPKSLSGKMQEDISEALKPIVEIELDGRLSCEALLAVIHGNYKIPYRILAAHVDYLGDTNHGKLLLQLQAGHSDSLNFFEYLNQNNIQNTIRGYA